MTGQGAAQSPGPPMIPSPLWCRSDRCGALANGFDSNLDEACYRREAALASVPEASTGRAGRPVMLQQRLYWMTQLGVIEP